MPLDGHSHVFVPGDTVELNGKGRRMLKNRIRTGVVVARNGFYVKVAFDRSEEKLGTDGEWFDPTWFTKRELRPHA